MSDDTDPTLVDVGARAHRARMRMVNAAWQAAVELADVGDLRGPVLVAEGLRVLARITVDDEGAPVAMVVRVE